MVCVNTKMLQENNWHRVCRVRWRAPLHHSKQSSPAPLAAEYVSLPEKHSQLRGPIGAYVSEQHRSVLAMTAVAFVLVFLVRYCSFFGVSRLVSPLFRISSCLSLSLVARCLIHPCPPPLSSCRVSLCCALVHVIPVFPLPA